MFAEEDMTEMSIAVVTADLGPPAIGISQALHCARKIVVERRPAAARIEFCFGIIERSIATPAEVGTGREETIIFAGKRCFSPLPDNDARLVSCQFIPGHMIRV